MLSRRSFLFGLAAGSATTLIGGGAGYWIARDRDHVLADERQSSGGRVEGKDGLYTCFQFRNPKDSGKIGLLVEIDIAPDADTDIELRSYNAKIGESLPTCNLHFGGARAKLEMNKFQSPEELGNFHSIFFAPRTGRVVEMGGDHLVALEPGRGVIVALKTPGIGAVCNFQWREI